MIDPDTLKGRITISRMVGSNKYKKEIDGYIIIKRGTFIVVVDHSSARSFTALVTNS